MDETNTADLPPLDLPEMDHTGGWKKSQYHPVLGAAILRRVAAGETMKAITADPEMPCYATAFRWVRMHWGFGQAYRELRAQMAAAKVEARRARREAEAWREARDVQAGVRPARRTWVSGRRSGYSTALAGKFCAALAEGASVAAVCARPGMPSVKQVSTWLRTRAEFRDLHARARDIQLLTLEDRVVDAIEAGNFAAAARWEGRIGTLAPKTYKGRDWPTGTSRRRPR